MQYPKDKDFPQVIKSAYDDETGRLKVESIVSDGIDALIINPDGSINVNSTSSDQVGTLENIYNEVTSVAQGATTPVVSYTCLQATKVASVDVSGTNIAEFSILINGTVINKKRTSYMEFNSNFEFNKGIIMQLGDIVSVNVIHASPSMGTFNASIIVIKGV